MKGAVWIFAGEGCGDVPLAEDGVIGIVVAADDAHETGATANRPVGADLHFQGTARRHAPTVRIADYLLHVNVPRLHWSWPEPAPVRWPPASAAGTPCGPHRADCQTPRPRPTRLGDCAPSASGRPPTRGRARCRREPGAPRSAPGGSDGGSGELVAVRAARFRLVLRDQFRSGRVDPVHATNSGLKRTGSVSRSRAGDDDRLTQRPPAAQPPWLERGSRA